MWEIPGKAIDTKQFTPFEPVKVLYSFDGPKIFTVLDADQELCLAYWCDEDAEVTRYIVVPFTERLVNRLERGELPVRDALDQARTWLIDIGIRGDIRGAQRADFSSIPHDALPEPGILLLPSHKPKEPGSVLLPPSPGEKNGPRSTMPAAPNPTGA